MSPERQDNPSLGEATEAVDLKEAGATLPYWDPEDEQFWDQRGKKIAGRNLWISIPNLLCAFAVWMFWSIIVVQIQRLHDGNPSLFNFLGLDGEPLGSDAYKALLYTLPAIAGLAGATLRIPNSFMIAISGGRNVITVTSLLLILPSLGVGIALQNPNVSFTALAVLAVLSGVGGGAFASSMSNISFFFPKRVQGTSLGLNAGLGNVGVSVMQVLLPVVMMFALFGPLSGAPFRMEGQGETSLVWIQNCGLVWVPILAILAVCAFFGMNNLPQHNIGSTAVAMGRCLWLEILGFAGAAIGVALLLTQWPGFPDLAKIFVILVLVVLVTLALMRWVTPEGIKANLRKQFQVFGNKHTWLMTWLYIMTFGSFIGYSAAFPKLIQDVFGYLPDGAPNPDAPNPLYYAWLGPLVGSLIRPVGGWLSDKWGGARVTHWDTIVMIAAAIGVGVVVYSAGISETPEAYFPAFLLLFLILFVTTGIGNGSTFRMVPIIFEPEKAGPVLGWISAIAAYGAFLIPRIFGISIQARVPEYALYGFAAYYLTCLAVNWWFYARKNAEMPC